VWISRLENKNFRQGLKEITPEEITHIQKVVKLFPKLTRHELAQTLCEHLSWYSPSGARKVGGCLRLLERLNDESLLILPAKAPDGRLTADKPSPFTQRTIEKQLIKGSLKAFPPIELQVVHDKKDIQLWNEYVERYHPLRYKRPFGNWLRYFLSADDEFLGCLLFSGAAKALRQRSLDRLERCTAAAQSIMGNQQQPLLDSSLGSDSKSGQPCFGAGCQASRQ